MDNRIIRFTLYSLFYIPIQLIVMILLLNFALYKLAIFVINKYYFYAQRNPRVKGLPYTQVAGYQDMIFFWLETRCNLSYNTMVCKTSGRVDVGELKRTLLENFLSGLDTKGEARYPKLRQVLKKGCLFSTWEYDEEFSIHNHITEVGVDFSTEAAAEKFVNDFEGSPLPINKPQWHCYLLIDPKVKDNSYIIVKFHHSICDGASLWKIVLNICDSASKEEIKMNKLVITQLTPQQKRIFMLKTFIMMPIYSIDHVMFNIKYNQRYTDGISGEKRVAWSNKLDFEKIREIKRKTKTTVNDVVMTLLTEAMRRYFIRHSRDDVIANEVIFGIGVALSGDLDDEKLSNRVAGMCIRSLTNVEGPFNQLEQINENMNKLKRQMWPFFMDLLMKLILTLPLPSSILKKVIRIRVIPIGNYVNMPGPSSMLVLNGVPFIETYGIVMTSWDQVMGIAFLTYNGKMHVALKVDRQLMENPGELVRDIEQVLEDMHSEIS